MNKKSIYSGIGRIAFAAAALSIASLNLCAESVTAHIPFAFSASGKILAAGDYTFEQAGESVVLITGPEPSEHAFILFTTTSSHDPAALGFDRSGRIPQLTSVHTSSAIWQFLPAPASKQDGAPAIALHSKK